MDLHVALEILNLLAFSKLLELSDDVNLSTLRISFGKNNTIEEVDYLIKTLKEIV